MNSAWLAVSVIAAALLSWLRIIALGGDLAKAEPKTLRYRVLHAAGKLVRGNRRLGPKSRDLTLGTGHSHRLDPDHRPATRPDQRKANAATRSLPDHDRTARRPEDLREVLGFSKRFGEFSCGLRRRVA